MATTTSEPTKSDQSMNAVLGKVVVKETRRGIGDLLVVLYDLDPASQETSFDDSFAFLFDDPASRTWRDLPGDRIGSVLTDRNGRFAFRYADEEFRVRNNERRPDLLLLVLAPDEGDRGTFYGKHPFLRLLHIVRVPRAVAGRTESYMITLPKEMLARFGVVVEPERYGTQASFTDLIAGRFAEGVALRAATKNHLSVNVRPAMTRNLEARRNSWRWLANPGLFAPGIAFVAPGEDAAPAVASSLAESVAHLAEYRPQRPFLVFLSPLDLGALGIEDGDLDAGADISVCDVLARKGFGAELVRVRSLLDELHNRRRGDDVLSPLSGEGGADDGTDGDDTGDGDGTDTELAPVDAAAVREAVLSRVLGQVAELPIDGDPDSPQALSDLEKVKRAIDQLELSGGPADVTAFRDFHTLQIAFRSVWTAAFDERLRSDAVELYKAATELHEDYGVEMPDPETLGDINSFRRFLSEIDTNLEYVAALPVPPDVLQVYPQMTVSLWNRIDRDGQAALLTAAQNYLMPYSTGNDIDPPVSLWTSEEYIKEQYDRVIRNHLDAPLSRAERLALEMSERLTEPYAFHYFAPGTINFALMSTYRQEWIPETYQAGRLVSTIPLAPGEKRTIKLKHTRKQKRIEREVAKSLREASVENNHQSRAELEVMSRTNVTTNFQMSAQGTFNLGIGSLTATSQFSLNQVQESSERLKNLEESTYKSAEKVRQEREMTVEVTEDIETQLEETHEISNPNDELTVTYLLYELERRFRVTARLHRLTPVVMVALDMPAPHEITNAWILEHAWIIRRVLLDDSFHEAIDMLEQGRAADEMRLELRRATWEKQREVAGKLETVVDDHMRVRDELRELLLLKTENQGVADATEMSREEKIAADILDPAGIFHDRSAVLTADVLEAERKVIEMRLEHAQATLAAGQKALSRAQEALKTAADEYAAEMQDHARKQTRINQLRLHIRAEPFHYMHAIWDTQHPDELLFSLYDKEVDILEPAGADCRLRLATDAERAEGIPGIRRDGEFYVVECPTPDPSVPPRTVRKRLIDVADLDNPLGFKGNYICFRLKTCTYITDFMMQEYFDDYFGIRDPATGSALSTEELLDYASELIADPRVELTEDEERALIRLVRDRLTGPSIGQQTIILPTGQVYMEALKGEQVLLEEFKRAHRGMDVLKVQEEVREARLENLRRAARLSQTDPLLDPAEIDKLVVVQGTTAGITLGEDD